MEHIQEIAPDGDVILVVGSDKFPKIKLRVSSVLLANTSPVFKTMFGPHFREGRQLRNSANHSPPEVPLPDDEWLPMTLLCKMAHLRCEEREPVCGPRELHSLAKLIDKYCCAAPLRLQSSALLLTVLHRGDGYKIKDEDLWNLSSAAYLMDCSQAFKVATSKLLLNTQDVFQLRTIDHLPANTVGAICEKRAAAWHIFCGGLPELGATALDHSCSNHAQGFTDRLAEAFKLVYWPPIFGSHTLRDLLTMTRALSGTSRCNGNCEHVQSPVDNAAFCKVAKQVEDICRGLCLACAKAGKYLMGAACKEHKWNM
ncbi:uncharacterized protein RHO25_003951 [Cercospora beticola]|uniref:BTB domain-containing protein n=1 Tax=Cercospora beticola TaxID=122368 RepID=A0ABZ0NIF4_CERBT|nr:hypothetical protein RHO25_003951 [Cercospora beticola]